MSENAGKASGKGIQDDTGREKRRQDSLDGPFPRRLVFVSWLTLSRVFYRYKTQLYGTKYPYDA